MSLIPALRRPKQAHLCKFEASLIYVSKFQNSQGYTEKSYFNPPSPKFFKNISMYTMSFARINSSSPLCSLEAGSLHMLASNLLLAKADLELWSPPSPSQGGCRCQPPLLVPGGEQAIQDLLRGSHERAKGMLWPCPRADLTRSDRGLGTWPLGSQGMLVCDTLEISCVPFAH